MTNRRSGARLWLLAFLGFFLLNAAWALAAPYDGPPDETQHAMRAYAASHGEWLPAAGNVQIVPRDLWKTPCFPMHIDIAANCVSEPGTGDATLAPLYVSEARFNPVYYVVTGWPVGIWPNWTGIMLARLLTGALMAALMACALVAAVRWTRHRAVVAGLVVAATPMIAHLGGSINPNGVEIAAGVAMFAGLIAVIHEQREGINRAAVALTGVSASILVTPRFSGLLWIVVIFGAMLIPSSWRRIKELGRSWVVRRWLIVIVVATVLSGVWTVISNAAEVGQGNKGFTTAEILRAAFLDIWPNVVNQMVGVMGWAETLEPRLIYVAWFMGFGLLFLGALAIGGRSDRWRMLALTAGTFVPLLGEELLLVNRIGWFNQGRYFLPGAVGLPMLAAHILAKRGITAEQMRGMTRVLALFLVPIHLITLAFTMTRWQSGERNLNPLKGSWMPPYGPVLPLVAGTLSVIVLLVMYWIASRVPADQPPPPPVREDPTAAGRSDVAGAAGDEPVTELMPTLSG